jgi:O-antigen/teichoic acid export membrane protein
VRWLAIPTSLAVLHTYVRGVLNGFRAIGRLAVVQTSIAVVNAALAYPVSMAVDSGYAIAFVFMMSASFAAGIIIGVYTIRKKGWAKGLPRRGLRPRIHRSSAKHFFSIASVTIITGFLATGALLAVRSLIVSYYGMDSAGIFNAAWAIGMTYALLALTSFGTYYLPTLSQIVDEASRTRLMNQVLWIATFAIVPLSVVAIVFKPSIVGLLYSAEFMPALDVIRWMLPAVYIKAAGWVLAMPMLAYAHMRAYLLTESLWYIGFVALSIVSVTMFDSFEGIGFGFLLMYVLYFAYVLFYTTRQWAFRIERRLSVMCAFGVALVVAASLLTWNHQSTSLSDIAILAPPVVVFIYLLLGKRRRKEGLRRVKQLFGRGE